MKQISIFLIIYMVSANAISQKMKALKIPKKERLTVHAKYAYSKFENYESLILFSNNSFQYNQAGTNYRIFSSGKWKIKNKLLILNSEIDSNHVPVKLLFDAPIDTVRWRNLTIMQVPVNLKGQRFGDARIFINDMSTYCFPYFDTCVGAYTNIDSVKVDFGGGFRSDWVITKKNDFTQLKIVANTDINLYEYLAFRNRRYKIVGDYLFLKE